MKRIFDICIAIALMLLLAPIMAVIAVVVRLIMGKPVLFRQERPGRHGVPFIMLKFRTMRDAVDAEGGDLPDSERITVLGRILRRTSLDELPGLWNVLVGDMSIVGPRPLLMEYLPLYNEFQKRRHEVRPGLTGWAQVHGRNTLDWDSRFELDVWYVDHQSMALDIKILFMTMAKVLKAEGISQPGHATAEPFRGGKS